MDDREQQRKIRHRLAVLRHAEELSGNVAAACRCYGSSRTVFYKWRNRFDDLGPDGPRDRSLRPHHSPAAAKGEAVERIVHLHQHYHFGPTGIAMHLKRYHDVEISPSGVWRVGHRLGLGRLPPNQR